MDKQALHRKLERIISSANRLADDVGVIRYVDITKNPEAFSALSITASKNSEKLVKAMRSVAIDTSVEGWETCMGHSADALGISVKEPGDGTLQISLPGS